MLQILSRSPRYFLGNGYELDKASFGLGEEIPASSISILKRAVMDQIGTPSTRDDTLFKAITRISGAKNPSSAFHNENFDNSINFFMRFLREDDPNLTIDETVEKALEQGVKFVASPGNTGVSAFGSIKVPFKVQRNEQNTTGWVEPSVDISPYRAAIGSLEDFYSRNITPRSLRPNKVSLVISATNETAAAEYTKLTTLVKPDGFSGVQGVNIATNTYGNVVPKPGENEFVDLTVSTITNNTIIINHESASKTPSAFRIDPVIETVLHEYGHTVENTLGVTWGLDRDPNTEAYAEVKARKVSEYGENDIREHFAESFAKYLGTGNASPEFKKFLEDKVGIKEINLEDYIPAAFQGTNFSDGYEKYLNENADLGGYTIKVTSTSSNSSNADMRSILNQKGENRFFPISLSWEAKVFDSQGRDTGGSGMSRSLKRDPATGEIVISHLSFKLGDSVQGQGLGEKITKAAIEYYKSVGIDRILTSAAATDSYPNGAYMWALQGFDFASEYEKQTYISRTQTAYAALSEYAADIERYEPMLEQNYQQLAQELAQKTNSNQDSVLKLIVSLRANGWVISNDLLNQLKSVAEKNPAEITAKLIAEIGRNNKKEKGKKFSTLGRHIMVMTGSGWAAKMELKD
jgi:hypothetical protein